MSAIAIEVGGTFITMYPGTKIKLLLKSPLFAGVDDPPSRIFNFKIPTRANAWIFNYAHVIDSRNKTAKVNGKIFLKGKYWKNCLIIIDNSSDNFYNIRVTIDKGYYSELGNTRLRDFKFENPTKYRAYEPSVAYQEYSFTVAAGAPSSGPSTGLILTVQNGENKDQYFDYVINYTPPTSIGSFLNTIIATVNADFTKHGVKAVLRPGNTIRFINFWGNGQYPGLNFVASTIDYYLYFDDPNYSSGYFANVPLQQTNHANDVAANINNYDYAFFPVRVPGFAQTGAGFNFSGVVNDRAPVNIGLFTPGFRGMSDIVVNLKNGFSPSAFLYKVLNMITQERGIDVEDFFFDDELKQLLLYSPVLIDYNWNGASFYSPSFLFSDILPDVTFGELLNALGGAFGFIADWDSVRQKVKYTSAKKVIESTDVEDWTSKVTQDYILDREKKKLYLKYNWPEDEILVDSRVIKQGSTIHKYKGQFSSFPADSVSSNRDLILHKPSNFYYSYYGYFTGGVWTYVAECLEDVPVQPNQEEVDLKFSPLFSDVFETNYVYSPSGKIIKWLLPYTNVKPQFVSMQNEKWPIRFLFYRGMQPGQYQAGEDPNVLTAFNYPLAHYHNYNYLGNKIGEYSLALHGEDGLIEKFLKPRIKLIEDGEPLKFQCMLNEVDFNQLDLLKKKQIGNQHYLIDEVEVTIGEEIELSTVKMYNLRNLYE